ncbi:MAG: aminotransferase class IV [Candidatus Paceibacterota bacterium]
MYCYLNGRILKVSDAKVSIFDIGMMRGFGVYEAMTSFGSNIFMWQEHLERFRRTADFLDIEIPISDAEIQKVCYELINKNGFKRANIKFILTGGEAMEGILYDRQKPTFYILVEEWKPIEERNYTEGARVDILENLRQYPEYKTTNYITAVRAYSKIYNKIKQNNFLETLYFKNGFVLEFSTSNIFIVKDGVLATPEENILKGITRKVAIDLAHRIGLKIENREVTLVELYEADECFLTSSFKDIVPIVFVGDKQIGTGKIGEITKKLMEEFRIFTES